MPNKKEQYRLFDIEYKAGKIFHPEFGFIPEMMVDGNEKIGKGVYHFSTLPTNKEFTVQANNKEYTVKGTCPCNCVGCYATSGNYRYSSVVKALAIRTWIAQNDIEFLKKALMVQIKADNIKFVRIHASGDFFSDEYIAMWKEIAQECSETIFWTYTKNNNAVNMFNGFSNANIVKSKIAGYGFNFGHCDYILKVYKALKDMGKSVYICRCGIDKNQHCNNCKGCSKHEFVLFIEHSTEYKAEKDPLFEELKAIIESQDKF